MKKPLSVVVGGLRSPGQSLAYKKSLVWDYAFVHPELIKFANALVSELQKRGVLMRVHEGFRSDDRQEFLRKQGVSRAGAGGSPHNFGCAVDIIDYRSGWDISRDEWALIGAVGKEVARKQSLDITWGGDWKFYDPAHWEIRDWRDIRDHHGFMFGHGNGPKVNPWPVILYEMKHH